MAITICKATRVVAGNEVRLSGVIQGPASYTTGGETLTAGQIRLLTDGASTTAMIAPTATQVPRPVAFDSDVESANARCCSLDRTNNKMKFFAGSTEVAGATNLSAVFIPFEAVLSISNRVDNTL